MTGWFRTHRDVFEHPLFAGGEMSRREAWLWLIAKAAWKDTKHRVGGELVDCPRGTLFTTLRELQSAWGWKSDTRVRAALKAFADHLMIVCETNAGKTQITICNYEAYQDSERAENAEKTQEERKENALKKEDKKLRKDTSSLRSDVERASAPAPERPKSEKRASRFPEGFHPNETGMESARRSGMAESAVLNEISRFSDYHRAKGSKMVDWQAAWRTWCGNYRPPMRAGPTLPPRRGAAAIFDALNRGTHDVTDDQTVTLRPTIGISSH